jgi:hypothetical protein
MTLLIFRSEGRVVATTAWTAEPSANNEIQIDYYASPPGYHRVYLMMPMSDFLAKWREGLIDLR